MRSAMRRALDVAVASMGLEERSAERVGVCVAEVVGAVGQALGTSSSELAEIAFVVSDVIQACTGGPAGGLALQGGSGLLSGLAAIVAQGALLGSSLSSSTISDTSGHTGVADGAAEGAELAAVVQGAVRMLGESVSSLAEGQSVQLWSDVAGGGSGLRLAVLQQDPVLANVNGANLSGFALVPPGAFAAALYESGSDIENEAGSRRLQSRVLSTTGACAKGAAVQAAEYFQSNLYYSAAGPFPVLANATVVSLETRLCGTPQGQLPNGIVVRFSVMAAPASLSQLDHVEPICLRFDEASKTWTASGVFVSSDGGAEPPGPLSGAVECSSPYGSGVFTVAFGPAGLSQASASQGADDAAIASGEAVGLLLLGCLCLLICACAACRAYGRRRATMAYAEKASSAETDSISDDNAEDTASTISSEPLVVLDPEHVSPCKLDLMSDVSLTGDISLSSDEFAVDAFGSGANPPPRKVDGSGSGTRSSPRDDHVLGCGQKLSLRNTGGWCSSPQSPASSDGFVVDAFGSGLESPSRDAGAECVSLKSSPSGDYFVAGAASPSSDEFTVDGGSPSNDEFVVDVFGSGPEPLSGTVDGLGSVEKAPARGTYASCSESRSSPREFFL